MPSVRRGIGEEFPLTGLQTGAKAHSTMEKVRSKPVSGKTLSDWRQVHSSGCDKDLGL